MSAIEHTTLSADDYVQEMLRAAEAQIDDLGTMNAVNRRAFLKLVGVAGGGLALAFYVGDRATALANANGSQQGLDRFTACHVDFDEFGPGVEVFDGPHALHPFVVGTAGHDNLRSSQSQTFGQRPSEHAGAADNDGHLVVESEELAKIVVRHVLAVA